jgi:hypothetical protein
MLRNRLSSPLAPRDGEGSGSCPIGPWSSSTRWRAPSAQKRPKQPSGCKPTPWKMTDCLPTRTRTGREQPDRLTDPTCEGVGERSFPDVG